jgi:NADPH:quinone reductase-like Zn-dependent oxidoreductase
MKAAVYERYGPPEVLRIAEVDPPTVQPDEDERVLIEVHSASVNPYDVWFRSGYLPARLTGGLSRPKQPVLGIDVAGTVAAVSGNVTKFKPGDRVFGNVLGAHAGYVRGRTKYLAHIPEGVSFNEAAAVPTAALTALQALRDIAQIRSGQEVLVYGASGGIGHFAVQLACHYGTEVTAVTSTGNLGWVRDLGAHHVIDYTREDFAEQGERYDLVLDAVGKRTFFNSRSVLSEKGMYITEHILFPKYHPVQILLGSLLGDKRAKTHLAEAKEGDFDFLAERMAAGQLRPVIEKVYPLDEIAAAHRHVEDGHTRGKVVVAIRDQEN